MSLIYLAIQFQNIHVHTDIHVHCTVHPDKKQFYFKLHVHVYPLHVHTCTCNPYYTITITCTHALFRPMINKKLEEKVCGDGPCLSIVFEDDIELMDLHQEIQVGVVI